MSTYDVLSDSEDELDWEEVTVPQAHIELEDQEGPSTRPNIEVTLEAYPTSQKRDTQYAAFICLMGDCLKHATGRSLLAASRVLNASSASTVTRRIP